MRDYGYIVEEDSFTEHTPYGRKQFTNIVATQNLKATRRLILACSYDSKWIQTFVYLGAVANAVSCAMIMDLARRINIYHDNPMVGVFIVSSSRLTSSSCTVVPSCSFVQE